MKILIICPLKIEYKVACNVLKLRENINIKGLSYKKGKIGYNEIFIINSGIGKIRTSISSILGIEYFKPDIVLDTGSCGSLTFNNKIGTIIIARRCLEYGITGNCFPEKRKKKMLINSGFLNDIETIVSQYHKKKISNSPTHLNRTRIIFGDQACGEININSKEKKEKLKNILGAVACNWETAGVFIGSIRMKTPSISIRVFTDKADKEIFKDYNKNIEKCLETLYEYIKDSIECKLFIKIKELWRVESIILY